MKEKNEISGIDAYIDTYPEQVAVLLRTLRETIKRAAPDASETISYQMPTFKLKRNLVHFAAYKNHIGFYPTPSAIEAFKDELAAYETSKGTIKFPLDEPLPLDLIRRIVAFRVNEEMARM